MNSRTVLAAAAFGLIALAAQALAGEAGSDALRKRIRDRHPILAKLQADGKVGETWQGYVEAVKSDYLSENVTFEGKTITLGKFLEGANADRKAVYTIIAEKLGIKPEAVGEQQAQRNFESAKPGEYLKGKDGEWKKKQ